MLRRATVNTLLIFAFNLLTVVAFDYADFDSCSSDADCAEGQTCREATWSGENSCFPTCRKDSYDCGFYEKCEYRNCREEFCLSDFDCGTDICLEDGGEWGLGECCTPYCVPDSCQTDSECPYDHMICENACVLGLSDTDCFKVCTPGCRTHKACQEIHMCGEKCMCNGDFSCVRTCDVDEDCPGDSTLGGYICENNLCREGCRVDSACTNYLSTYWEGFCADNECVDCLEESDCTGFPSRTGDVSGNEWKCDAGRCVETCASDRNCLQTGMICNPSSRECEYGCREDKDCRDEWNSGICGGGECLAMESWSCSQDSCLPGSSCVPISNGFLDNEIPAYEGEGPFYTKTCVYDMSRTSCGAEECKWECENLQIFTDPEESDCPDYQICVSVQYSCGGDGSSCSEDDGPCRCFGTKCIDQTCVEDEDCIDWQNRLQCTDGRCEPTEATKLEEALGEADMPLNIILVLVTLFEIAMLFRGGARSRKDMSCLLSTYVALNVLAAGGFCLKFLDWSAILSYRDDVSKDSAIDMLCVDISVDAAVTVVCAFIEIICDIIELKSSILTKDELRISIGREFFLIFLQILQGAFWVLRSVSTGCATIAYQLVGAGLVMLVIQLGILTMRTVKQCKTSREVIDTGSA